MIMGHNRAVLLAATITFMLVSACASSASPAPSATTAAASNPPGPANQSEASAREKPQAAQGKPEGAARQASPGENSGAGLSSSEGPTAAPSAAPASSGAGGSTGASLTFTPGSTVKVEQLIGDFDKQTKKPTLNQTQARFGIVGTDLGNSFEHNGKVYFLFGDTPEPGAPDPMGYSDASDPNGPLALQFESSKPGSFLPVKPPGVSMGAFEVPVAGLSLNGVMYVVVSTNYTPDRMSEKSVLTRFDEAAHSYTVIRDISQLPAGHFVKMTLRLAQQGVTGLPGPGPYILMFGSGKYRGSNAYLAVTPAQSFTTGEGTRYFAGLSGSQPRWSEKETDAAPLTNDQTIGDISASYLEQAGLWVMTYDSRSPNAKGVNLRYAQQPWGPWSDPLVIYNEERDHGMGTFIHDPRIQPDDGLAGPVIGAKDAGPVTGGTYAPYLIDRFTQIQGNTLTLQYVLSTWNPYTVVRMKSTLTIEQRGQ